MTHAQLNRAVANTTGESVQTIARRGFSLIFRPARGGRTKRRRGRRSRQRTEAVLYPTYPS